MRTHSQPSLQSVGSGVSMKQLERELYDDA